MDVASSTTTNLHDGQELDLPSELVRYIRFLNEPIEKYSPYFDALLIQRRNHAAFFRDLKDFRSQQHVIALLTSTSADDSVNPNLDIKQLYRNCSKLFLESRFAHPWCRTTASKEGWFKAEWGSIKKQSDAKQREEDRLHKLLVPIWCGFRVRMMPTDEQMAKFLEKEREMPIPNPLSTKDASAESSGSTGEESQYQSPAPEDSMSNGTNSKRRQTMIDPPTRFNAEAFVSEDDDRVYEHARARDEDGDAAANAAKLFIGAAAAGFLAKNPRAKKYLMKKLQKR